MKKIDPAVWKETLYVFVFTVALSVIMQVIFILVGKWDYTVVLGNLLGIFAGVANFFLMGLTVQSALDKDEKEAKTKLRISQTLRIVVLFGVAVVGYFVPIFNLIAVVIPYLFPRFSFIFRPLFNKKQ